MRTTAVYRLPPLNVAALNSIGSSEARQFDHAVPEINLRQPAQFGAQPG